MAKQRLQGGFTPIPNQHLEAMARMRIPQESMRIFLVILRKTNGFQKDSDIISLSQFSKAANMLAVNVPRAIKFLKGSRMIVAEKQGHRVRYSIQNNSELWADKPVSDWIVSPEIVSPEITDTIPLDRETPIPSDRHKRNVKEENKINGEFGPVIEKIIRRINELSGKTYPFDRLVISKNIAKRLREGVTEQQCISVVEDRWRRWGESEKMAEHFNPITLFHEAYFAKYLAESSSSNGKARVNGPPPFEDLGDGFIEVNGIRMTRKEYDRRWK